MTWRTVQPFHNIVVSGAIKRHRIVVKEVWHDGKVSIGGELVCDELGVRDIHAHDICEHEDRFIRGLIFRVRKVGRC